MAQSEFSPQFPGSVSASSFQSNLTGDPTRIPQRITIATNGTTPVSVFGSTADTANGFAGTFTGVARVISRDTTGGNISLKNNIAGVETTVFTTLGKGIGQGSMTGSYFPAKPFSATGTATVQCSSAGNAVVELDFIVSNPALPGAQ